MIQFIYATFFFTLSCDWISFFFRQRESACSRKFIDTNGNIEQEGNFSRGSRFVASFVSITLHSLDVY